VPRKTPEQLRSHRWIGPDDLRSFGHRSRLKQMGYGAADYDGKPVIGILNTWSDLNNCHTHFPQRALDVKRGVYQAGGFPVEIPVTSLSETFMKPSAMFYRNMLAMEAEEVIRSQPIDGVVLMGGCDKTTPALIMGATSANVPAIYVPAGPMLRGNYLGTTLGSGTDAWKYWAEYCAGTIDECTLRGVEDGIARSAGHCMTMGTASTMTSIAETLGLTLSGAASIPAVHSGHSRMAAESGRRIVEMVWEDLKPSDILTREAFDNAVTVDMAIGGSTNAIIHLIAMAGRAGMKLPLERFDEISHRVPVIANIRPSGEFLMEDFFDAGGLRGLLSRIRGMLNLACKTVSGRTLGEDIEGARVCNDNVIRPLDQPISQAGATFVLRGNLAPDGCVIKPTCAEPRLLKHTGAALVFKNYPDLKARIDDESLDVTPDSVIVLQSAGPQGAPEEAAAAGRAGHGAHLRRAHERHELRHVRAARLARERDRRPAGIRARRRPDRVGRGGAKAPVARDRRRGGPPPRALAPAGAQVRPRLRPALRRRMYAGARGVRFQVPAPERPSRRRTGHLLKSVHGLLAHASHGQTHGRDAHATEECE
jgi:dihydroxy-acid dehydratase